MTNSSKPTGAMNGGGGINGQSPPSDDGGSFPGTRFGGLAAHVEASISASIDKHLDALTAPFPVTAAQLSALGAERTREALADLLEQGISKSIDQDFENLEEVIEIDQGEEQQGNNNNKSADGDVETPCDQRTLESDVRKLIAQIRNPSKDAEGEREADKNADMMANVLTTVLLRSSPENGIDPREVEHRRQVFGTNAIAEKETDSFCKLCWEAIQDFVLIMLIVLGIISIVVEVSTHEGACTTCWIEGFAILVSVCIVVMVTAGIDYGKQFAFLRLTRSLHDTNIKQVIRDGKQVSVTDDDIVVGDILSVNSHNLASIPADCVLLGPEADLKMNESSLTGESKLIHKKPGDVILSGTDVSQGSGKMVVIAVGVNSVAGKIKAHVYESADHNDEDGVTGGDDDENSPLFVKLDIIARRIGMFGTVFALLAFIGSCVIGLAIEKDDPREIITYLITAITVLAVAVPEGLPLAVTLALAFSSNKMMRDQNLVKHLDACETMGCATTICTDKTGTLTANKMTVRALFAGKTNYLVDDPAMTLGEYVRKHGATDELIEILCRAIAINTMNETVLYYSGDSKRDVENTVQGGAGNPTEVALLHMAHDMGHDYQKIRNKTKGRSDQGALGEFLAMGKQFEFSSARKMMSWAVPLENGGYRLYCKGASEVVLARCTKYLSNECVEEEMNEGARADSTEISLAYARRGMRCLALAYRDLPEGFALEETNPEVKNSDGSDAFGAEIGMTSIALVGIEDPLRAEVPSAIQKCYEAGIDVRMVTGDNPNTAVSIAYQAGILRDFHFLDGTTERVADNLKPNVLMEGKTFRSMVYRTEGTNKEFDQATFDKIWPHLRVLARSSPDDKLTLAHGLNQSNLFADKEMCHKLLHEDGISIFPDRQVREYFFPETLFSIRTGAHSLFFFLFQVVAMTGDGAFVH
jgi:Ca2+ transporting ATPase